MIATLAGCNGDGAGDGGTPAPYVEQRQPCAAHDPLKKALFGDLHSHTALSFDAWAYDVRTTPHLAYEFARGNTIYLPPLDAAGQPTVPVKLDRPLDFAAVTDHSEFLGEVSLCTTPGSATYDDPTCVSYRPPQRQYAGLGVGLIDHHPYFCGNDGKTCVDASAPVWRSIQDAAEAAYDRSASCGFTSFVAYEYTLSPFGSNMHRNVIFKNERTVPLPITYFEAPTALELWQQLQAGCIDRHDGCDVLAIPHNSNISNGLMFHVEYPGAATPAEEQAQARLRASMEPLVEITQHKGDSECLNGLATGVGVPDELCDYEKVQPPPFKDCGKNGTGSGGFLLTGCTSWLDFVRGALEAGLQEEQRIGANPYPLGIIASTDTHNGTPGRADEKTFTGHLGITDNTPDKALAGLSLAARPLISNPGGLAGVWAEENSRAAIFDALRHKEVFGTSGPRITVRLFGGWNYPDGLCANADLVARGYQGGVPMGGVLPARGGAASPSFVVAALKDPGTAATPGTPLQRVQIVKGWIDAKSQPHEQVFDVAGDANNGASVDPATCAPTGKGADSLCAVWRDPAFDPAERAFYYARVVENPSCRWSTWVCLSLPADQQKTLKCDDLGVPKTIQERAWSSPIWYSP